MTEQQVALFNILWKARFNPVGHSIEELRELMGLSSKSGILRLLDALEERDLIKRRDRLARSIELTGKVPRGFQDAQVQDMWAYETDSRSEPGQRLIQPLSLCYFRSELPGRARPDPNTNPTVRRVRVTIERID